MLTFINGEVFPIHNGTFVKNEWDILIIFSTVVPLHVTYADLCCRDNEENWQERKTTLRVLL